MEISVERGSILIDCYSVVVCSGSFTSAFSPSTLDGNPSGPLSTLLLFVDIDPPPAVLDTLLFVVHHCAKMYRYFVLFVLRPAAAPHLTDSTVSLRGMNQYKVSLLLKSDTSLFFIELTLYDIKRSTSGKSQQDEIYK